MVTMVVFFIGYNFWPNKSRQIAVRGKIIYAILTSKLYHRRLFSAFSGIK